MDYNELLNEVKSIARLGMEDKEEGIKKCNVLLETYSEDNDAKGLICFYKGLIYENAEDMKEAIEEYEKAIDLGYELVSLQRIFSINYQKNNLTSAYDAINRMIELKPKEYLGYDLKFNFLYWLRVYDGAEELLDIIEKFADPHPLITLNRVRVNIALGKISEALEIIESIKEDDIFYDDILMEKARILELQGDGEACITILKDVYSRHKDSAVAINLLGMAQLMRGDFKGANITLSELFKLSYKDSLSYLTGLYYYGITLKAVGSKDQVDDFYKRLKARYSAYILNNPDQINAALLNGAIQYELGNYEDSLRIFNDLEEREEEVPEVYFFKALIYKATENIDKYQRLKAYLEEKNKMYYEILLSIDKMENKK